jgi:VWFA-related protein
MFSPTIRRRLISGGLLLCALGSSTQARANRAAGAPASARADRQTRSAERAPDLPSVDFVVLGADGRPAPDLNAADVSVKIDGRARAIRALQLITIATAPQAQAPAVAALPAPFGRSSTGEKGRTLVLVLDDDSLRAGNEARLRQGVTGLLAGLTRRDRVSLVTMPYGGVKVPLTEDHVRVERALSMTSGQAAKSESGSEMACRTRRVLESLVGLLETYSYRDEPMTLLFFSTGLAGPRRDAPMTLAPGMCELNKDKFEQVAAAAARARANVFVIQPDDAGMGTAQTENIAGFGFSGSNNPLEGLENLAGVTGGERLHLATSADALSRVLNYTSAYYVASLEPQPSDRDGRIHKLDVRVTRPGVVVRARPSITLRKDEARRSAVTRANAREMLRVADGFNDLSLRATGYVSRNAADGTIKVTFVAEPTDPLVRFASAAAALIDENGRIVGQWTANDMDAAPMMGAMVVPAGTYRLRVAATDQAGRGGTADEQVVAALTPAGPLQLSTLVLGLSRSGVFVPTLEFGTEPVAIASFEIYGGAAGTPLFSALEVARTLDGPALATLRLTLERAAEGRYVATGAIPLGALPPGDFVVRATVGIEGQPAAQIVRTLRKVAR